MSNEVTPSAPTVSEASANESACGKPLPNEAASAEAVSNETPLSESPSSDDSSSEASPADASPDEALPFFTNRDCPYFPCHTGINPDEFNCLFCFCPLYALGPHCGGNFTYTASGVKSCMTCEMPHRKNNGNSLVNAHFEELSALAGNRSASSGTNPARRTSQPS